MKNPIYTVGQLREVLNLLPDHMPVVVDGWEDGTENPKVELTKVDLHSNAEGYSWTGEHSDPNRLRNNGENATAVLYLGRN